MHHRSKNSEKGGGELRFLLQEFHLSSSFLSRSFRRFLCGSWYLPRTRWRYCVRGRRRHEPAGCSMFSRLFGGLLLQQKKATCEDRCCSYLCVQGVLMHFAVLLTLLLACQGMTVWACRQYLVWGCILFSISLLESWSTSNTSCRGESDVPLISSLSLHVLF